MAKAFRIFKKILRYTIPICLGIILLAATGVYLFQDKIINLTFKEINKHLVTKIEVDPDVKVSIFDKFPEISIKLNNVRVYENVPASTDKLATLKNLFFTFNAFDFLFGSYVINNIYAESGDIRLKIDKKGLANYLIFKKDSTSQNHISFDLKKIILVDVMFSYINEDKHQEHQVFIKNVQSKLKVKESVYFIALDGDVFIHKIGIGGIEYFKEKDLTINSEQEYHEDSQLFKIHPSSLTIQGSEFKLSGFYEGNEIDKIDVSLKAEQSTIATLFSLLPENISRELSIYRSSGNIIFEATAKGFFKANENPLVKVDFGFSKATFYHPDFNKKISEATLQGSYTNGKQKNLRTSSLKLNSISAIFDEKSFSGNFELDNFDNPLLKFNIKGSVDVGSMIKFYPIEEIARASGILDIDLSFEGRTENLRTKEGKEKVNTTGKIALKNIHLLLKKTPVEYKNVNGNFTFNKSDVTIKELSGNIGKSDFKINGSFKNFITKLIFDKERMMVEAKINSNHIDLDELLNAYSSGSASPTNEKDTYPYLSDYKCILDCHVKSLVFRRLHAKNIEAIVNFNQPLGIIRNASLDIAGGKVHLNSLIDFQSQDRIELNTKATLSNIYVDSIFYIAENFNQDFIIDKNLKGQLTADFQLFFAMDNDLNINSPSVIANINASVLNGELNDFEPMKKLSLFVNERKLENIKFSELKNKIFIENSKVVIPEMEIKSNVSNISVHGTHTFDQHMDYKLTIPLKKFSNRPKTDKDEAFGAIEEDHRGNTLIFLTIKGTSDDYKIAYDKKRTGERIKDGLKREGKEIEQLFKIKKPAEIEETSPDEYEFFDF